MNKTTYIKAIVLAALSCAVSGCGIYGSFQKPEFQETKEAFGDLSPVGGSGAAIFSQGTVSTGEIIWQEFFQDDCLRALIDTALANNTDIRTAVLRIEEAEASLKTARLAFLPGFDVSPSASFTAASGSASSGSFYWQLPVGASWEVDIFGSLRNAKKKQLAAFKESVAFMQTVQSELISTVAIQYYTLLSLDAQKKIYEETEKNWRENVEITRKLMEAGRYNSAAVYQAQANYYSICNNLSDIRRQIRETENQLCSLLGKVSGTEIMRNTIEDWAAPESISTGIPVKVLSLRPDVRQAEFALEQAYYATGQSRSAMYPSLTITGSFDFGEMLFSALGSLVQPIFKQGTLRAQLKIAIAQQEEAEAAFRQTIIDAGIEVNNAMIGLQAVMEKSANYSAQVDNLEKAVESTRMLMQNGSTTYLEVLTAQETLLNAQIGEIGNKLNEISETVTLYRALGGGAPLQDMPE